jgi:hypothetical protein
MKIQDIPQVGKLGLTVTSRARNGLVRRIIGVCPAPVANAADITALYAAEFGAAPAAGKRLFIRASTMVGGFESLPRQFQARAPAA